jgi:hypothetical protein
MNENSFSGGISVNNKEEQKKPAVLGEDFDVFPKLDENDLKGIKNVTYSADPEKAEPKKDAPPPEPTELEKKAAAIDDKKWVMYNRIVGIAAGLISSAFLYLLPLLVEGSSTYGLIAAVVIAFLGPGFAEKKLGRSVNTGRKWMLITFGASLLLFAAYMFLIRRPAQAS